MCIASNGQAATQSPHPRQPNPQAVSPTYKECSMAQERAPSYWLVRGRFSQVPLHLTTAILGAWAFTSRPKAAATLFMVSAPPTGHRIPSIVSDFTAASANPRQPG